MKYTLNTIMIICLFFSMSYNDVTKAIQCTNSSINKVILTDSKSDNSELYNVFYSINNARREEINEEKSKTRPFVQKVYFHNTIVNILSCNNTEQASIIHKIFPHYLHQSLLINVKKVILQT